MISSSASPIRRKLMTMLLVTSGVVLVMTCATFVGYELLTYRKAAARQLATLGEIIAAESTGAVAFDNPRDATEILAALKAEHHIVAACLYDKHGNIFTRYPADAPDQLFPPAPQTDGYRFADDRLIGFAPLVQVEGSERLGTLFLMSDMEAMYERLRLYGGIALLVTIGASIVAYLLARAMQRQISHPIFALVETARAVSDRGDYSVRAAKHDEDELGVLTEAFNHMLSQIEEQNAVLEKRVSERTAELESANRELEAFCSSAAHDLRTPLRAITGFADVLLDGRAKIPPADAQRFIRLIRDGSGQMSDLIHALLAFSRLGRQPLAQQTVDLADLCREAYRDLSDDHAGRRVDLTIGPLPKAEGDPALLRLVFMNLLSNALKYSRTRAITVVEIGATHSVSEGATVYFVRDNGVGFDMRDAGKLFGVFQRLHHAHEFEGTGVGLATVRRIIDRHGGRIWAEALPDGGATFYFTLKNANAPTSRVDAVV
ncbi:MAG: ATP-binding protein [Opitutus sp.]